jgi:flagellar motor protein MotB
MLPPEEPVERAPVWLITYSDLMTLLLVFFVLLFSISEFRQTERFQGVAKSLHSKFGARPGLEDRAAAAEALLSENVRRGNERRKLLIANPN